MKQIKDISPKGRKGDIAQLSLTNTDIIVSRAIFNLDYLERIVKILKKDIGKTNDIKLVEVQFIKPSYGYKDSEGRDLHAIIFRACTCDPRFVQGIENFTKYGIAIPDTGYFGIAPIKEVWPENFDMHGLPGLYELADNEDYLDWAEHIGTMPVKSEVR